MTPNVLPAPARTTAMRTSERWRPIIEDAARRFALPASWIAAVLQTESAGRTMLHGRPITSPAGAMGLMQLMPGTWRDMRARLGLGADPYDPRDNILAGAAYLRQMRDRFGYPGLFAAYNAGPARLGAALRGDVILPAETRAYVARITHRAVRRAAPVWPSSGTGLFFMPQPKDAVTVRPSPGAAAADAGLFVSLSVSVRP